MDPPPAVPAAAVPVVYFNPAAEQQPPVCCAARVGQPDKQRRACAKSHKDEPGFAGFSLGFLQRFRSCLCVKCGNVVAAKLDGNARSHRCVPPANALPVHGCAPAPIANAVQQAPAHVHPIPAAHLLLAHALFNAAHPGAAAPVPDAQPPAGALPQGFEVPPFPSELKVATVKAADSQSVGFLAAAWAAHDQGDMVTSRVCLWVFLSYPPSTMIHAGVPDDDELGGIDGGFGGPNHVAALQQEQVAGDDRFAIRVRKALRELDDGQIARAMRAITGESPADLSSAGQQLVLRSKFLLLGGPQVDEAAEIFEQGVNDAAVPEMTQEQVVSAVMKKAKKTAAGYGGWMFRHLQKILQRSTRLNAPAEFKAFPAHLTRLVNMINRGVLDSEVIWPLLNSVRGVALKKVNKQGVETDDVRPLGISCVFKSLAGSLLLRHEDTQNQLAQVISRSDLSFNVRGGAEAVSHTIRALLELRPDSVVLAGDVKNAFGSFARVAIARLCERWPAVAPTLRMMYSGSTRFLFPHRVVITTNAGVAQGDIFGGTTFSGIFSSALLVIDENLPDGVVIIRYMDDFFVVGPPATAFDTFDQIVQAIATIGLELSAGKSEAYVPALASHLTRAAVSLRAQERNIPVKDGLIACGAAIGPDAFVTAFLVRMRTVHTRKVDGLVKFALDANSSYSAQQALMLLRYCVVPSTMMFLARTHAPHLTQPVFRVFDDHVASAVFQILGVHPHYLQDAPRIGFARKLIALDVVNGGLGLTSMESVAVAAYLGSIAQSMPAVQRFLPPNYNHAVAFRDAALLVEQQRVLSHIRLTTVQSLCGAQRLQQIITQSHRPARFEAALAAAPTPEDRAQLRSQASAVATAWAFVIPGRIHHLKMGNALFKCQGRNFLRLPVSSLFVPERNRGNHVIRCLACNAAHHPHDSRKNITSDLGDHAHVCRACSGQPDDVGGWSTLRHNSVRDAILACLHTYRRRPDGEVAVVKEPHLLHAHGVSPAAGVAAPGNDRADIKVTEPNGKTVYLDLTITAPTTTGHVAHAALQNGYSADKARGRKIAHYRDRWQFHADQGASLCILAMETGGRMHPEFLLWLKSYLRAYSGDGHHSYYWAYRNTVQRIAVALRSALALSFSHLEDRARLFPSVLPALG